MQPDVGKLEVFPSIWGRKYFCTDLKSSRIPRLIVNVDWAGGPGDSKEDVKWLDMQLKHFFAENPSDGVSAVRESFQRSL